MRLSRGDDQSFKHKDVKDRTHPAETRGLPGEEADYHGPAFSRWMATSHRLPDGLCTCRKSITGHHDGGLRRHASGVLGRGGARDDRSFGVTGACTTRGGDAQQRDRRRWAGMFAARATADRLSVFAGAAVSSLCASFASAGYGGGLPVRRSRLLDSPEGEKTVKKLLGPTRKCSKSRIEEARVPIQGEERDYSDHVGSVGEGFRIPKKLFDRAGVFAAGGRFFPTVAEARPVGGRL